MYFKMGSLINIDDTDVGRVMNFQIDDQLEALVMELPPILKWDMYFGISLFFTHLNIVTQLILHFEISRGLHLQSP